MGQRTSPFAEIDHDPVRDRLSVTPRNHGYPAAPFQQMNPRHQPETPPPMMTTSIPSWSLFSLHAKEPQVDPFHAVPPGVGLPKGIGLIPETAAAKNFS